MQMKWLNHIEHHSDSYSTGARLVLHLIATLSNAHAELEENIHTFYWHNAVFISNVPATSHANMLVFSRVKYYNSV